MNHNSIFYKDLEDIQASVTLDLKPGLDTLLVVFGGIAGSLGIPPFEFFNTTQGIPASKIFVRDLNQSWYHGGLRGITDNIEGVRDYLKERMIEANARRTVLVGNSMGGYAAIIFGIMIGANVVHSFSPQTFIDNWHRVWHRDFRWHKQIAKTHHIGMKKYFDLKNILKGETSGCEINIYYSTMHRLDKIHAERMRIRKNIVFHSFEKAGHGLVKYLRDEGKLSEIIC
jgi:hypothetical protein